MAANYLPLVLKNAMVLLTTSTADLSGHVKAVTLSRKFDDLDDDRMGLTAHSHLAGVEGWSGTIELIQDFQSTNSPAIDATLNSICGGPAIALAIRPVNAARTSDNPEYTGNAVFLGYEPINGKFGDLLKTTVPFMGAGNLSRFTSSS